jgi:hypothetical protein
MLFLTTVTNLAQIFGPVQHKIKSQDQWGKSIELYTWKKIVLAAAQ